MPIVTAADMVGLHISTLRKVDVAAFPASVGRYPFPLPVLLRQVVSDRLTLAGEHLRAGDQLVLAGHFRSSISRHYYAMYHAARAVVFAEEQGDDYERHNILPHHMPSAMVDIVLRETELRDARLLRNQADYDCYPVGHSGWEVDARTLASVAANFVRAFEDHALTNGHV